jgi:hypothetical protein
LKDNKEYTISEDECKNLVKFFDSDNCGRLSYYDFLQLLLPCEDNFLRKNVQERKPLRIGRFDYLPFNQEYFLADLIASEIRYQRRVENLKEEL